MDGDAVLTTTCADNHDGTAILMWHWTGVPSDTSEPRADSYFVRVVDMSTSIELVGIPGAEDNAFGEDYSVQVPTNTQIYLQVINEAKSFHFEADHVIVCQGVDIGEPLTILPHTGVSDFLLPLAVLLTAVGTGIVRLANRWKEVIS